MLPNPVSAPDFTIDVANGPSIALSELWRDHHLLLWFNRGLVCPFCRRQMVQLARIQEELRSSGTVTLQVTPTAVEVARDMLQFFPVDWPYACDPDWRAAAAYGLEESQGLLGIAANGLKQRSRALGLLLQHPAEPHPEALPAVVAAADSTRAHDGGIVIVGRGGLVRFKQPSGKLSLLPSNDDILKAVRRASETQEGKL